MDGDMKIFVVLLVGISTLGWIINNWIRAKHGYELEDEWGGKSAKKVESSETTRLKAENRELNDKLDTMQDRMIVLEKIVTDRGYSLSDEIEALRHTNVRDVDTPTTAPSDNGTPLNLGKKETRA